MSWKTCHHCITFRWYVCTALFPTWVVCWLNTNIIWIDYTPTEMCQVKNYVHIVYILLLFRPYSAYIVYILTIFNIQCLLSIFTLLCLHSLHFAHTQSTFYVLYTDAKRFTLTSVCYTAHGVADGTHDFYTVHHWHFRICPTKGPRRRRRTRGDVPVARRQQLASRWRLLHICN